MTKSQFEMIMRIGKLIALKNKATGLSLAWMIGPVISAAGRLMIGVKHSFRRSVWREADG